MNQQRFTEVFNQLTARRKEVLEKFLAGETDKAIAQVLFIKETTVRKHIEEICRQFALDNDKFPGQHRPKRENLLRLFAKHKPELLSRRDVQEIAIGEKTVYKNIDSVEREAGFTDPQLENDLHELVQRVRSKRQHRIQDQCGQMKLLNISQLVDTDNLYVDVNILKDIPSQRYVDISYLAQRFDPTADDFDRFYLGKVPYKRVPGLEVIEDRCKVMVLGKPGSGKTTFLQYMAIECDRGRLQADRVPIFIRLSRFAEDARDDVSLTLLDYIDQEFRNCGVDYPRAAETLLKNGKGLILLDGLDEVSGAYSLEVVKQIRQFCDRYYKNSLVITCRTNAQNYSFKYSGFIEVEIADFKDAQIKKFAEKWFTAVCGNNQEAGEAVANEFLKKLKLRENKRIRDLAVTPILLHLTCLFFRDRSGNFPTSRAELYQEGLNILLSKWDKTRGIQRDEVYGKLSPEDKKDLLSQLGATLFKQNDYFPKQDKLQQMITTYLELPKAQGNIVLKSIEDQHGLLVERAQGIYSFSHLTFQEYLTARKIINSADNIKDLKNWLIHIPEKRWREVFLLIADMLCLLPSADNLLLLMKETIDNMGIRDLKLQQFLSWVNQKSLSIGIVYKQAAVRAFYCTFDREVYLRFDRNFIGVLDRDFAGICIHILDLARAIDINLDHVHAIKRERELALDIALNLALNLALDLVSHFGSHYTQSKRVLGLFRTLNFILMLESSLEHELQKMKNQILAMEGSFDWEGSQGKTWVQQLRSLMIRHRNIGHTSRDWQLRNEQMEDEEMELLSIFSGYNDTGTRNQYYDANKLLMDCLNSAYNVSPQVRAHIEDTLLLPIDEIREIEKRIGIK